MTELELGSGLLWNLEDLVSWLEIHFCKNLSASVGKIPIEGGLHWRSHNISLSPLIEINSFLMSRKTGKDTHTENNCMRVISGVVLNDLWIMKIMFPDVQFNYNQNLEQYYNSFAFLEIWMSWMWPLALNVHILRVVSSPVISSMVIF